MVTELKEGKSWSHDDEKLLLILRRDGHTYKDIGLVLGRSEESCRKKYNKTRWDAKPFYDSLDAVRAKIYKSTKDDLLEKVLAAKELGDTKKRIYTDIISDALERSIKALPSVAPPVYSNSKKTKKKHDSEDVGLILSDLHIGHSHTLEETGGLSAYNYQIFLKRVEVLKAAVTDIVELHSHLYDLPTLHIFCLGDIVAGMNETGKWSNVFIEMGIMEQFAAGEKAISDMIYYFLGLFKEVNFYGVYGNHGRMAKQGVEKPGANWDSVTYSMIQAKMANNPQVKFHLPNTWWQKIIIKNHKFLLAHGDDIKSSAAVPINGLQNFVNKWATIANFIPNYTIAGHFHTMAEMSTAQGKLIVNGSFIGPDIYALKTVHASSPPEQRIFGIHSRRGLTWKYDIDLREDKAPKD